MGRWGFVWEDVLRVKVVEVVEGSVLVGVFFVRS